MTIKIEPIDDWAMGHCSDKEILSTMSGKAVLPGHGECDVINGVLYNSDGEEVGTVTRISYS